MCYKWFTGETCKPTIYINSILEKWTRIISTGQKSVTRIVMYLRLLFGDKKIKLVYSNGQSQIHLSCPVNDGSIEQRTKKV